MYLPTQGSNAFESRHGGSPLLQNELVAQIAAKHRVTPAQALHTHTCTCTYTYTQCTHTPHMPSAWRHSKNRLAVWAAVKAVSLAHFTYRAGAGRVECEARLHLPAQERAAGKDRAEPRRRLAAARRGGHAPPCRARLWLPVQHRLLPGLLRLPERAVVPSAATGEVTRKAPSLVSYTFWKGMCQSCKTRRILRGCEPVRLPRHITVILSAMG